MQFSKHFNSSEFDSPDQPGSGAKMKKDLIEKLSFARNLADIPFKINSGFRSKRHNAKVKGSPSSSHMKGYAVDISINDSLDRFRVVYSLLRAGFTRIGVYKTFVHVDCDPDKTQKVIWYQ